MYAVGILQLGGEEAATSRLIAVDSMAAFFAAVGFEIPIDDLPEAGSGTRSHRDQISPREGVAISYNIGSITDSTVNIKNDVRSKK